MLGHQGATLPRSAAAINAETLFVADLAFYPGNPFWVDNAVEQNVPPSGRRDA